MHYTDCVVDAQETYSSCENAAAFERDQCDAQVAQAFDQCMYICQQVPSCDIHCYENRENGFNQCQTAYSGAEATATTRYSIGWITAEVHIILVPVIVLLKNLQTSRC